VSLSTDCDNEEINVVEPPQEQRIGKLTLLNIRQVSLESSDNDSFCLSSTLNELHSTEIAGVLDIKWCHGISNMDEGLPLFAAADSGGDVSMWSLKSTGDSKTEFQLLEVLSTDDNDALALSLDWSTAVSHR